MAENKKDKITKENARKLFLAKSLGLGRGRASLVVSKHFVAPTRGTPSFMNNYKKNYCSFSPL
jgi:hypothetical protein